MKRLGLLAGLGLVVVMVAGCNERVADRANAEAALASYRATDASNEEKRAAIDLLSGLRGNADIGSNVFQKHCIACHSIGAKEARFGPNLADVAARRNRYEIIESILNPSAQVDPNYQTVNILLLDGRVISGLLVDEDSETVSIHLGEDQIEQFNKDVDVDVILRVRLSSMPENLINLMSAEEFLDLVEYLTRQTKTMHSSALSLHRRNSVSIRYFPTGPNGRNVDPTASF